LEPEHTLAAYLQAIEDGADALECDVRLTSDGTLVCVHDRRIDRTSKGRGTVSARHVSELSQHDFSYWAWHDLEEPSDGSRTGLLTLETLLSASLDKRPDIRFAIETKHPVRYGGYVERELADVLARYGLDRPRPDGDAPVRMMSFSRMAVLRMQKLAPAVPTVFLAHCRRAFSQRAPRSRCCARILGMWPGCTPRAVRSTCGPSMKRRTSSCASSKKWMW
jgi:glycerophosphoryl diester phosphodiesterase